MELHLRTASPCNTSVHYRDAETEAIWRSKIRKASRYYPQIEFLTVKHGVRDAMLLHHVEPGSVEAERKRLAEEGLLLTLVAKEAKAGNGFAHVAKPFQEGSAYTYRAVVTRKKDVAEAFLHAQSRRDDVAIGRLLGFPSCCCEFFGEVWSKGYMDPIWQQAAGMHAPGGTRIRMGDLGDYSKILATFRYVGVRAIPHFACSFSCGASLRVADDWCRLARELRIEGLEETLEILKLPFSWTCLDGVARIATAGFSIVTPSVPCRVEHVIGVGEPREEIAWN